MKNDKQFNFPKNLEQIIQEEGIWEDDSFAPLSIIVMEAAYKEEDILSYELSFDPTELSEEVEQALEEKGIDGFGYDWEDLIREYIRRKSPKLEQQIIGDSEGATCVLWVASKDNFIQLLDYTLELIYSPESVRRLIES